MSKYNKHVWRVGEVISAELLNAVENQLEIITPGATTVADEYNLSTTYEVGDYCLYNGGLWRCIVQSTGNAPEEGMYWTNTTLVEELNNGVDASIASAYSTTKTYHINDYVIYDNKLYRNIYNGTTSGSWNSDRWEETILSNDVTDALDVIDGLGSAALDTAYEALAAATSAIDEVEALTSDIADAIASIPADYSDLLAAVAPTFSTSDNYSAGEYVWHSTLDVRKLYRFTAAHAAGAWTGSDATAVALADEASDLKSAINEISDVTDNIFDMSVFDEVAGITRESNGYYKGTANAFSTAFANGISGLSFDADSRYYLSVHAYTDADSDLNTSVGLRLRLYDANNTQAAVISIKNNATTDAKYEVISTSGYSISKMTISKNSTSENTWHIGKIMLIKSDSAVDYYPHKTALDRTARNSIINSNAQILKTKSYIKDDYENRQSIFFNPSEIEAGKIKQSTGLDEDSDTTARTIGYIKLAHPENAYKWNLNGYYVGILEYSKNADETFTRINYRYLILNNGIYVPSLGTTHIRLQFQKQNADYITDSIIQTICDNFTMREGREVNKYLKVCSFNMARLYSSLSGADAEGLQKQIWNYLEFIGKFNPHVIQAQEAGGIYWYWDDNHTLNMNTTVFNRKYGFSALPSVGKKTWSQYNFSETEDVAFTHQATGDNDPRTYSRSYLHFEGKDICILNTHCTYRGDFEDARQGQFQELVAEMANHEYCILCGDFNAYDTTEFNVFDGYNMANCGDYGKIDTWAVGDSSQSWPNHAIDNIITTPNILIQNVETGKYDMDFFSDHVPLVATLKIMDIDSTTT